MVHIWYAWMIQAVIYLVYQGYHYLMGLQIHITVIYLIYWYTRDITTWWSSRSTLQIQQPSTLYFHLRANILFFFWKGTHGQYRRLSILQLISETPAGSALSCRTHSCHACMTIYLVFPWYTSGISFKQWYTWYTRDITTWWGSRSTLQFWHITACTWPYKILAWECASSSTWCMWSASNDSGIAYFRC